MNLQRSYELRLAQEQHGDVIAQNVSHCAPSESHADP
jgi:hypothetical protein